MRICKGCAQKLPDNVEKCRFCGKGTYEYKAPAPVKAKPAPKYSRCRVCGQLLQLDAQKCKYCGGGTFVDTDPKIKKTAAQMAKESETPAGNTENSPTPMSRTEMFAKAKELGLNVAANISNVKLAELIANAETEKSAMFVELETLFEELAKVNPEYERTGFETVEDVKTLIESAGAPETPGESETPAGNTENGENS